MQKSDGERRESVSKVSQQRLCEKQQPKAVQKGVLGRLSTQESWEEPFWICEMVGRLLRSKLLRSEQCVSFQTCRLLCGTFTMEGGEEKQGTLLSVTRGAGHLGVVRVCQAGKYFEQNIDRM